MVYVNVYITPGDVFVYLYSLMVILTVIEVTAQFSHTKKSLFAWSEVYYTVFDINAFQVATNQRN